MSMRTLVTGVVFGLLLGPTVAADQWIQYRNGPAQHDHARRGYPPGAQRLPPPGFDSRRAPPFFYGVPPGGGIGFDPRFHDPYPEDRNNDRRRDSRREFRREQERYGDDRRRDRRWRADERRDLDDGSYRGGVVTRQHRYPPPAYGPYSAPGYPGYPPDYGDGYYDGHDGYYDGHSPYQR